MRRDTHEQVARATTAMTAPGGGYGALERAARIRRLGADESVLSWCAMEQRTARSDRPSGLPIDRTPAGHERCRRARAVECRPDGPNPLCFIQTHPRRCPAISLAQHRSMPAAGCGAGRTSTVSPTQPSSWLPLFADTARSTVYPSSPLKRLHWMKTPHSISGIDSHWPPKRSLGSTPTTRAHRVTALAAPGYFSMVPRWDYPARRSSESPA